MTREQDEKRRWIITVNGYGSFEFVGTEGEAEAMRRHKARWEGAVATKKRAEESTSDANP